MPMIIDAHVHFRDFSQKYKETVKHGLEVARDSGVSVVFDMPNTNPPIKNREILMDRFKLAKDANVPEVFYGVYLGATADPEQLKRAVQLCREFPRNVAGIKLYAGESVGDLAVKDYVNQFVVFETLAQEGYEGVLGIHAESEEKMLRNLWDPKIPISHCDSRPPEAEVESIRQQINLYSSTKFPGKVHIHHISVPESVEIVNDAKEKGVRISCGVTPHHLIYDFTRMKSKDGILYKMNPPLRPEGMNNELVELLRAGKIDFVETDHAPHTLEDKFDRHMSGIPGLPWWPMFIEYLKAKNFSDKQIKDVTFNNAQKVFGIEFAKNKRKIRDRTKDYSFNPYSGLKKELGF